MVERNTMLICLIIYCLLIFVIYLIKSKRKTYSRTRFIIVQLCVIWCLLFNLFAFNCFRFFIDTWVPLFLSRMYISSYVLLFSFLECYFLDNVFGIPIYYAKPKDGKRNLASYIMIITSFVGFWGSFLIPNYFEWDGGYFFSFYGPASTMVYILCFSYLIFDIIFYLTHLNKYKFRNSWTVMAIPIVFIIAIVLNQFWSYSFFEMGMVISISMIYFSVEKPDEKEQTAISKSIVNIEKSSRFKSEFLSSTSHEIKTPLNAMIVSTNNLLHSKVISSNAKNDLNDMLYASNVLYETISNILLVSKLEQENMVFNKYTYNLKDEIKEFSSVSKIRSRNSEINFFIDYTDDVPDLFYGDRELVLSIINNSLSYSNASIDKGTIGLKIDYDIEKSNLIIEVENICDNCGELYTNLDDTIADLYECVNNADFGINLSNVLTKKLGGKIDYSFENQVQNSIFYTIPQEKNDVQYSYDNISYNGKNILVVDDSNLNLKLAQKILVSLGVNVSVSENGNDAIEQVKHDNFDVILLDINMPGKNGEETLKELKTIEGFDTPVIALTAEEGVNAREKFIKNGFDDYIVKPFKKSELISHLEKCFKGGNR